jgi:tRNA1Val (adenine37-N6)-methyltransferase
MPNDFFRFKQFTIHQHKSAMKVCTDACLFGAFVAEQLSRFVKSNANTQSNFNILDIGAGTGLLSLMLAQEINAHIDAVEMDDHAFEQAVENVNASPFYDKISVTHSTIQQFQPTITYDFIITNPPFFQNDLKSDNHKRNLALHSEALSLDELMQSTRRLLSPTGSFAVLLPFHRSGYFEELAIKQGYFLQQKVSVKQTEKHAPFRSILLYSPSPAETKEQEIIIKEKGEYSNTFVNLLSNYYLYL